MSSSGKSWDAIRVPPMPARVVAAYACQSSCRLCPSEQLLDRHPVGLGVLSCVLRDSTTCFVHRLGSLSVGWSVVKLKEVLSV